jgi:Uma2 family endonuclease
LVSPQPWLAGPPTMGHHRHQEGAPVIADVDDTPKLPTRPLRRVEYEALVEQGFLEDEGVELLEGAVVYASEEGTDHAAIIRWLLRTLFEAIPASEGEIGASNPIAATDLSEPEPDLAVFPPSGAYRSRHPTTASLLIEVSNTSLRRDLAIKARIYAQAQVPDYWVVDVVNRRVIVHRDPRPDGYADVTRHRDGVLRPLHHAAVEIAVKGLFA